MCRGVHGGMQRCVEVNGGAWRGAQRCEEVCRGVVGTINQSESCTEVRGGAQRCMEGCLSMVTIGCS